MSSNSINISVLFADKFGFEKTSNTAQQNRLPVDTEDNSSSFLNTEVVPQETRPEEVNQCGAELIPWLSDIIGGIIDDLDGETKDGSIGGTEQGATGDCWLLSGINALSYTQEGRKIISNALEYKKDYTIVHTMAGDYVITDDEIARTKGSFQYSDGDDDMIIFELACEKIIDDCINGTISLDENIPEGLAKSLKNITDGASKGTKPGYSSTESGWEKTIIYLLSGKYGELTTNKDKFDEILERFKNNNNKDIALGATTQGEDLTVEDIHGNKVKMSSPHAFSVKKYDGQNITLVNPWNSDKDIVLSKETFMEAIDVLEVCDLSENNPTKEYINQKAFYNSDGMVDRTEERVEKEGFTRTYKYIYNNKNELSEIKYEYIYDSGFCGGFNFDEDKNYTSGFLGNKDTKTTLTFNMDNGDNRSGYQLGEVDKDGNLKYTFVEMTDEIGKRIDDNYQILQYDNLSASDVFVLARDLSDVEFDKAMAYLKDNPNATLEEVVYNINL